MAIYLILQKLIVCHVTCLTCSDWLLINQLYLDKHLHVVEVSLASGQSQVPKKVYIRTVVKFQKQSLDLDLYLYGKTCECNSCSMKYQKISIFFFICF